MRRGIFSVCWLFFIYLLPVLAQTQHEAILRLRKPLLRFEVRDRSALEGILELGAASKVPLGVILEDDSLCKSKVTVLSRNQSGEVVLDRLLGKASGYQRSLANNVVLIAPKTVLPTTTQFLNLRIPHFVTPADELQAQMAFLQMAIRGVLRPSEGTAGSIMSSHSHDLPAIDMRDLGLQQILDLMVSRGPGGAWILFPVSGDLSKAADRSFAWTLSYADTATRIREAKCAP